MENYYISFYTEHYDNVERYKYVFYFDRPDAISFIFKTFYNRMSNESFKVWMQDSDKHGNCETYRYVNINDDAMLISVTINKYYLFITDTRHIYRLNDGSEFLQHVMMDHDKHKIHYINNGSIVWEFSASLIHHIRHTTLYRLSDICKLDLRLYQKFMRLKRYKFISDYNRDLILYPIDKDKYRIEPYSMKCELEIINYRNQLFYLIPIPEETTSYDVTIYNSLIIDKDGHVISTDKRNNCEIDQPVIYKFTVNRDCDYDDDKNDDYKRYFIEYYGEIICKLTLY